MIDVALMCLALTIYHEARGEPVAGMYAVGHVVMNRVTDERWPNKICDVVVQDKQFSWIRNSQPIPMNATAWNMAQTIAMDVKERKPGWHSYGATHYHHKSIEPIWTFGLTLTQEIGNHVFYR